MRFRVPFKLVGGAYGLLACIPLSFTASSLAVRGYAQTQRSKTSDAKSYDALIRKSDALAFWAWTGWLSLPLSVWLLARTPYDLWADPVDRKGVNRVQRVWAEETMRPFFEVKVESTEGLRQLEDRFERKQGGVVFVANHASWLDPYALMAGLKSTPLHFLSKREIFYIPLVGWVCYLIGHVGIDRKDKISGKNALETCKSNLIEGDAWSVVFFAEGSRPRDDALGGFKMGAFNLAADANVPIVPVTIKGTRKAMAPGNELKSLVRWTEMEVIVHPMIWPDAFESKEKLRDACRAAVASAL